MTGIFGAQRLNGQPPIRGGQAATTDPFTRYTTPGQCVQAALRLRRAYWRDRRPDTVVYAPATDSVPTPVVAAARACAARFQPATVPARELLNLARLYLWAQQDAQVQYVAAQLLRSATKQLTTQQRWTWYLLTMSLLHASPVRLALAQTYLAHLDAFGISAAPWQLLAHTAFAEYAVSVNDLTMAQVEARRAIAASKQLPMNERRDRLLAILGAYDILAVPVALTRGGAAARAVLDTAQADLRALRPPGSAEQQEVRRMMTRHAQPYGILGQQGLPPVHGTRWYTQGISTADTVHPRRGASSLLVFANASCEGDCYPMYAILRRLSAKYRARGLDIVLMAETHGYFRSQLIPSAPAEGDSIGHYFTTFLQLPAMVAVETTAFSHLADGRRTNARTANHATYDQGRSALLIDPQGAVRWIDALAPNREQLWDAIIHRTLEIPSRHQ